MSITISDSSSSSFIPFSPCIERFSHLVEISMLRVICMSPEHIKLHIILAYSSADISHNRQTLNMHDFPIHRYNMEKHHKLNK